MYLVVYHILILYIYSLPIWITNDNGMQWHMALHEQQRKYTLCHYVYIQTHTNHYHSIFVYMLTTTKKFFNIVILCILVLADCCLFWNVFYLNIYVSNQNNYNTKSQWGKKLNSNSMYVLLLIKYIINTT